MAKDGTIRCRRPGDHRRAAVRAGRQRWARRIDPGRRCRRLPRLGTCGRSTPPIRACGCRQVIPRDRCERLFPAIGEQFRDQYGEPILQLAADTSPGVHYMLFPPCDPLLYQSRGLSGHPNCRDNFLTAVASAGISLPVVPDPVNLFQNSGPQPDGRLVVGTAASLPGQFISFLARRDLVFVLTACSVRLPATQQTDAAAHCGSKSRHTAGTPNFRSVRASSRRTPTTDLILVRSFQGHAGPAISQIGDRSDCPRVTAVTSG